MRAAAGVRCFIMRNVRMGTVTDGLTGAQKVILTAASNYS